MFLKKKNVGEGPSHTHTFSRSNLQACVHEKLRPVKVDFDEDISLVKESEATFDGRQFGFCLLTSRSYDGGDPHKVDFEYSVKFGKACQAAGVSHMTVVSVLTATPKSYISHSRIKGQMEMAFEEMKFPRLTIFQPSLVIKPKSLSTLSERLTSSLHRYVSEVLPLRWSGIYLEDLVRAMVINAETCHGPDVERLMFDDILQLVGKSASD